MACPRMQSDFSYYGIFQNQAPSSFFSNFLFLPFVSSLPSTFYSFPTLGEFPTIFLDLKFWPCEFFFISIMLLIFPSGRTACKTFDIFPLAVHSETRWSSELLDQKKESCYWSQWAMKPQVVLTGVYGHTWAEPALWLKSLAEFAILPMNFLKPQYHVSHGVTRRRTEA